MFFHEGPILMSKMILKSAVLGAVMAAATLGATSAHAASATGTAKAKILRQITLTNTSDLEFATVISGANASTVAVSTSGAVTCGANLTCTGTTTAANFNVQGTNNAVVLVGGDASVTLNGSLGGTMSATLDYSATSVTLANSGPTGGSFQVGGTLSVGVNQASGDYTGTFNVTANYQ
jgi:Mat/Ecp fimbriae major subunit